MIKKTGRKMASIIGVIATFFLGIFSFLNTAHTAKAEAMATMATTTTDDCIRTSSIKHTEIPNFIQDRLSPSAVTNAPHKLITALVRKDQEKQFLEWLDAHDLTWGLSYQDIIDAAIAFRIEMIQKEINEK